MVNLDDIDDIHWSRCKQMPYRGQNAYFTEHAERYTIIIFIPSVGRGLVLWFTHSVELIDGGTFRPMIEV